MGTQTGTSVVSDLAVERFLLGCIMRQNNILETIRGISPQTFYSTAHHVIFAEMQKMYAAGVKIDLIALGANLKASGVWEKGGGSEELSRIWDEDVYLPNALEYAKAVAAAAARRASSPPQTATPKEETRRETPPPPPERNRGGSVWSGQGAAPPFDLEIEMSLLGCIIHDGTALDRINGFSGSSFYHMAHGVIFNALTELHEAGSPTDLLLLREELNKKGFLEKAGGAEYLGSLFMAVASDANAEQYASIVTKKARLRSAIMAANELADGASSLTADPDAVLGRALELLQKQAAESAASHISPWVDATELTATEHKAPEQLVDGLLMTHSVAVLAAAPKVGKTFLGLEFALSLACGRPFLGRYRTHKAKTAYIALEDGEESIGERLHALSGDIYPALGDFIVRCRRTGKAFDLLHAANCTEVINQCKGFGLIVIDSLRRAHKLAEDSSQDAAAVGAAVWRLCNETGATVLLIHHLVKNWDPDADVFTRIRGSGDIFADCDTALVLDRKRGEDWVEIQCVHRRMVEPQPFCFKRVHGSNGAITWALRGEPLEQVQSHQRMASIEHQIIALLEATPGLNARQIRAGCEGRGKDVDSIRKYLVENGAIRTENKGGSTGVLHFTDKLPELFEPGSNG